MHNFDWIIIILYFSGTFLIGYAYKKKAGGSTEDFFLSGRKLPWWLAGLSMVATTFAADTPLAVTELVGKNGIAGNWLWWNMLIGGMLTVFFFARLWRRANILTDVEFIELRYSGKSASFLRGFKSLYLGVFMNTVIMGWVNLAMMKILIGMFPEYINQGNVIIFVGICMLLTSIYSAISGLWGVAVTDAFQFLLAMGGCIILAVIVLNSDQIGGITGLTSKLPSWALNFTPEIGAASTGNSAGGALAITISSFLAFIGIQWWASWYPGAEPGGGGYVAQRIMSAKNEKHSLYATLFFQIAHYCIRPWPWIIVGLCAIVLYPDLPIPDKGSGYVKAMNDFLPVGLKGLMLAAFFAAYMSTIATHLNWGTSYFINDFYKRFVRKGENEKHYVLLSRLMTIGFMVLSVIVTFFMESISGVWSFVIECGAGLGLVLILRWFWWRINAVSEITATIAPFIIYSVLYFAEIDISFPDTLFIIVPITTIAWIIATYLTKPTSEMKLSNFYKIIRPGGPGWKQMRLIHPEIINDKGYGYLFLNWILGIVLVYMFLFGLGKIIFGEYLMGLMFISAGMLSAVFIAVNLKKHDSIFD
ncbi:MAG: Na+:solute symporter [Ignavibacteria bacterium]|jgi:Na+/proline symporter|nr:Na+:solute symporter [Ignavibacteria bacterium]